MSTPGSLAPPPPPSPPPSSSGSFDLMKALRVLFDDPDWVKKTLFGSLFVLLGFVFIGIFWSMGYIVRVIRNTARGDAQPLPDWDDLGGIFQDGLAPVGAMLAYVLGICVVIGVMLGCVFGLAAAGGSSDAAEAMGALGVLAINLLSLVLYLAMLVFLPAALTRLVLQDRFAAAFEFGEIFDYIKRNAGNYLLAILAYFIASMISQFGVLLLCIGLLPAAFWATIVLGWGLGEAARLDPGAGR